jgi:hypothetical protein
MGREPEEGEKMSAVAERRRPQAPATPPRGTPAVGAQTSGRFPFSLFDRIANIGLGPAFAVAVAGGLLHSFVALAVGGVALAIVAVCKVIGFVPVWLAGYRAKA